LKGVIAMKRETNVLIVDDEKTVCNSCKKILTQVGYRVEVASSGQEAIDKIRGDGFDVVITDWKMPRMDGLEVTRRVKQEKPEMAVIIITGYPSVDNTVEAIRSGASDFVTKPFTPDELSDAMLRALSKGQAVPADLVVDRLMEKEAPRVELKVAAPVAPPVVVEEKKVGPAGFAFKSAWAAAFGRLFFVALGPLVIFALLFGVSKRLMGKTV
jgi:DNA-binding NtrC family response regulator